MRKVWSNEEVSHLVELYEIKGLSLSEIYPIFNKKYIRTLESIKIKLKKLKLKHTKEQTKEIKSRLNSGKLNGMFGRESPLKGLNKYNSEIIKIASKKNSDTRIMMHKNGLLPDVKGCKNPMYGKVPWNSGLNKFTDERIRVYGEKISKLKKIEWVNKTEKEKWVIVDRLNKAMIQVKKQTKIELKIERFLKNNNINYETNYRIDKFLVDFYLNEYNIVIECDGDYWHSNPRFYDCNSLNEMQIKNKERDIRKDKMLNEHGIRFIRFWEYDIHNLFHIVEISIKNVINN